MIVALTGGYVTRRTASRSWIAGARRPGIRAQAGVICRAVVHVQARVDAGARTRLAIVHADVAPSAWRVAVRRTRRLVAAASVTRVADALRLHRRSSVRVLGAAVVGTDGAGTVAVCVICGRVAHRVAVRQLARAEAHVPPIRAQRPGTIWERARRRQCAVETLCHHHWAVQRQQGKQ